VAWLLDFWLLRASSSIFGILPRSAEVNLDWRALVFASLAGGTAALISGVWPAIRATRGDLAVALSHAGRSLAPEGRSQSLLVAGQFALAVVLLSTTSLMLRSYYNLQHVEIGFDPSHDLTFHVGAAWNEDRTQVGLLQKAVIDRLQQIPGVLAAGFTNFLPASDATLRSQIQLQELAHTEDSGKISVGTRSIGGDYLKALNATVVAGEACPALAKVTTTSPKALVNRRFADLYAKGQNLVGMHFHFVDDRPETPATEIVGVVGDIREDNLRSTPVPYAYFCMSPGGWPDPEYIVRAQRDPRTLNQQIHAAVREIDSSRAIFGMKSLQEEVDSTLDQTRLQAGMISVFGLAAVSLAALGLYGLVTLAVAARTKEIGIRLALGAKPSRILADVVSRVGILLAVGAFIGIFLTWLVTRQLQSVAFGVRALDVVSVVGVLGVLVIAGTIATIIPAYRAARLSPIIAIRD
jgi:predicted permease